MSADFIKTMNSAWARGRVQQADLDVFANQGAKVHRLLYSMAGNGKLTMDWLLGYWEKVAISPKDAAATAIEGYKLAYTPDTDQDQQARQPIAWMGWDEFAEKCTRNLSHHRLVNPKPSADQVDHPDHYQAGGMETIDVIDAYVSDPVSFALGNVIKYVTRAGRKTGETATKDLAKARWYLDHALTHLGETK